MSDKVLAALHGEFRVLLVTGHESVGVVHQRGGVWLEIETSDGPVLVSQVQVVAIAPMEHIWQAAAQGRAAKRKPAARSGPLLVQDFWTEDRLKQLSEAFLDGLTDQYLAEKFKQSKTSIRDLRKAFEAARGTIDDLDVSQPTRVWIKRWQAVLTP